MNSHQVQIADNLFWQKIMQTRVIQKVLFIYTETQSERVHKGRSGSWHILRSPYSDHCKWKHYKVSFSWGTSCMQFALKDTVSADDFRSLSFPLLPVKLLSSTHQPQHWLSNISTQIEESLASSLLTVGSRPLPQELRCTMGEDVFMPSFCDIFITETQQQLQRFCSYDASPMETGTIRLDWMETKHVPIRLMHGEVPVFLVVCLFSIKYGDATTRVTSSAKPLHTSFFIPFTYLPSLTKTASQLSTVTGFYLIWHTIRLHIITNKTSCMLHFLFTKMAKLGPGWPQMTFQIHQKPQSIWTHLSMLSFIICHILRVFTNWSQMTH